jgi:hypothetical protein
MDPVERILNWLSEFGAMQREIAFVMVPLGSDMEFWPDRENPLAKLAAWLRRPSDEHGIAARALIFRELIEYHFRDRMTGEGLDEHAGFMRFVLDSKRARELHDDAALMLAQVPFRKARWKKIGESWDGLVAEYLTNAKTPRMDESPALREALAPRSGLLLRRRR